MIENARWVLEQSLILTKMIWHMTELTVDNESRRNKQEMNYCCAHTISYKNRHRRKRSRKPITRLLKIKMMKN